MKNFFVVMFLALVVSGCGCTHVDAGNVGIMVEQCSGGGVQKTPVPVGYHTTGPCTTIVEFPVFQQTSLEEIHVNDKMGLPIETETALNFTVESDKVPDIYLKFRKDLEHIQTSYIRQMTKEAMRETFAKYTAQEIYSDKQEIARAEVQGLISEKLKVDGFDVTQFTINKVIVPQNVVEAIQAKVTMVQQAQQAEQAVAKSKFEGDQRIAKATADATVSIKEAEAAATVKRTNADAEAYSNRKIAESISPTLVEYMKIQKWNGTMPTVTGGGNIISLNPAGK